MSNAVKKQAQKIKVVKFNGEIEPERTASDRAGVSCMVEPVRNISDIKRILAYLANKVDTAKTDSGQKRAFRDYMLFKIGFNVGLRISDLLNVKFSCFYNSDFTFKEYCIIQPEKTKKAKKLVTIYFNDAVKQALEEYRKYYKITDLNAYLFGNSKGEPLKVRRAETIIKNTCKECGLKGNFNSHTLRKTFAYQLYINAENKSEMLVYLQDIFNHSSTAVTMHYIGLTADTKKSLFMGLNL